MKKANKKVVENSVIVAPKTSKDVPAVIAQLKEQLKALKGDSDEKISLEVSYNHSIISKVLTVKELLEISASVHARATAFTEEVNRYKLAGKLKEFTISDKTESQWEKIIEKAISELVNKTQITKIEQAIKKLSQHLDAETKLQNELTEILELASEKIV